MFVFLGFSSGPGVAVGSLLRYQCLALLPCPGSFQRCGAPRRCPSKSLSSSKAMCVAKSVSGPSVVLSGLYPVGKALLGSSQGHCPSRQLLCSQNIFKFLYAAAQQVAFVSALSWFPWGEMLLINMRVEESLTPAECVGVIKGTEDTFKPM